MINIIFEATPESADSRAEFVICEDTPENGQSANGQSNICNQCRKVLETINEASLEAEITVSFQDFTAQPKFSTG